MARVQKITPFLWFDGQAENAARFYTSIFNDAKILEVTRYGAAGPGPAGSVMTVSLQLEGQAFVALNGGPQYKFTPAISLMVTCDSQAEVDHFWAKLTAGGEEVQCGWLTDRFGLSWQVVPSRFLELIRDPDTKKTQRVIEAMLAMKKLDVARLEQAWKGR
jgi:predicted 3-demethylubiquinone-9 3-methyltransferase (glyoxalase superfamily)